jgi:tetratricopeptide (TPR) repeat protein
MQPSDSAADDRQDLRELISLQTNAIKRLEEHFAPETQEEIEERRFEKIRALIVRIASIAALAISGAIGAWEFGVFVKESWDVRATAAKYAEVGVRLYYEENNTNVAKEFLAKALELNPNNAEFLFLDAYIDGMAEVRRLFNLDRPYSAEELDAAYRAVAKSILLEQQEPDEPEAYILRGQIYAALGERTRATEALDRAINLDPANDFAIMRLGVVEYGAGRVESALTRFQQAIDLNPRSKWAYLWRGIVFSESNELDAAREALNKALELDPRFDLALYNLAWIELKETPKNYAVAEQLFRKALAVNPAYKEALYGLGMVYGYQKEYQVARGYLSNALELDPGFLTAWKWRGVVNYELGEFEAALNDFSSGLELDPSNADLFVRRARVAILQDSHEQALADLQFARKFDPKNPRIYLYLGQVYQNLDQIGLALEQANKAIELNPRYADALGLKGSLLAGDRDQIDAAIQAYQMALEATSYRPERFVIPLSQLLRSDARADEALTELSKVADSSRESEAFWLEMIYASIDSGDFEKGATAFKEYVKLVPTSEKIAELRALVRI